jgi:hypothetical protein
MSKNTILNVIGLKETQGLFGVEIEAEGHNLPTFLKPYWRVDDDPSLKAGFEGREYVMPKPSSLEGVREALNFLDRAYIDNETTVEETITSGVHVHVNVQDMTPKELFTFITTYFILEELLVTYCGPSREGNHFCLRAKDAEWIIHELIEVAINRKLKRLDTDTLRYCSLNVYSLFKYGSIEFRAMRGTRDLDAIYEWVEILARVREASLEFKQPSDVLSSMSYNGEEVFVRRILGDKADFFLRNPHLERMVREGARIVQPLAYAVDWGTYKDTNNNPFAKAI